LQTLNPQPYTGSKQRVHNASTGLLMIVVCAMPLLVLAQDDADRVVESKITALEKAWNQDRSISENMHAH
jgi:hypothetical protein